MPVDLTRYQGQYSQAVLDAAQRILTAKPEQIAQSSDADGTFNLPRFLSGTIGWWQGNGHQVASQMQNFRPESDLLAALGYRQQVNGDFAPGPNAIQITDNPAPAAPPDAGPGPDAAAPSAPSYTGTPAPTTDAAPAATTGTPAAAAPTGGTFSVAAYIAAHPDLLNNYLNDPGYAKLYGSLAKYILADATANGSPDDKAAISAGRLAADVQQGDKDLFNAVNPGNQTGGGTGTGGTPAAPAQFSVAAYLKAHPDILSNYISDPGYERIYGSLANYVLSDAKANGTIGEKTSIAAGNLNDDTKQSDADILTPLGYVHQGGDSSGPDPLEQKLLNDALPTLQGEIAGDKQRQGIADTLTNNIMSGVNNANDLLSRTQGGHFDGTKYFQQNPDVAAAYQAQGGQAGTGMTIDQFAEQHYLNNGQKEGRQPFYTQSAQLAQDFANADTTTKANIAAANQAFATQSSALSSAIASMQTNLQGDLATRATALQQQLDSLNSNLTQLDATQKAALTKQIATQVSDLEQSITSQRQALATELTALGSAADAQSQAKRAALQQEIQGLTDAQAPLSAARVAAADMQATAINVGLQSTQDQLTADNARSGFVGGSTYQDAALARATITARQQAAQAMGTARTQNASDTRDIGIQAATGQRSISDALADANADIARTGATGNMALSTNLATGRQALGDAGATGLASIENQTGLARAGIGAQGANTTYANTVFGADSSRTLADALAQGNMNLTNQNAQNALSANQTNAAAKATYYDNNYARTLAAALAPITIAGSASGVLAGLPALGTAGTNAALNLLKFWTTNSDTPATPGALATTPSTAGNGLSTLGSGLVNSAISIGNSYNWGKTPTNNPLPAVNPSTGLLSDGITPG